MAVKIQTVNVTSTNPKDSGGKGAGLYWLTKQQAQVPRFVVLPILMNTLYRQKPDLVNDYLDEFVPLLQETLQDRVSIRSGAEKSLPGLMDTILDVPLADRTRVQNAIEEVWMSYDKVPEPMRQHTTGTAVIIQEMLHGDKAGVVFPTYNGISKPKVAFVFRYADTGEEVVSGKVNDAGEMVIRKGHAYYSELKRVHDAWLRDKFYNEPNPPEFEIVVKDEVPHFLQVRYFRLQQQKRKSFLAYVNKKLNLIVSSETIEVPVPTGKLLQKGSGGLWGTGILSLKPMDVPYILVVKNGVSLKHATDVLDANCKGVVWKVGSPHAHLGVLCRNHNKGYALIEADLTQYLGKQMLLCDGCLYRPQYTLKQITIKSSSFAIKWNKFKLTKPVDPQCLRSTTRAIHEFVAYKTWVISHGCKGSPYKWIKRMLYWGMLASLGEARYVATQTESPETIRERCIEPITGILGLKEFPGSEKNRNSVYNAVSYAPLRDIEYVCGYLKDAFYDYSWSNAYGGTKWGAVAELTEELALAMQDKNQQQLIDALNYLENTEHNNGVFYDKFINTDTLIVLMDNFNSCTSTKEWLSCVDAVLNIQSLDAKEDD